jgi:hypothetical protein
VVILSAVLSAANVIFSLCNAALQVRLMKFTPPNDRWLRVFYFFVCLYWGGVYLYVLFFESSQDISTSFGQVFIRPALTFTLALMLAGSLYRYRSILK